MPDGAAAAAAGRGRSGFGGVLVDDDQRCRAQRRPWGGRTALGRHGATAAAAPVSRRRRRVVLAGLALVLGGLAASDVAGREAALRERLGPLVAVVVVQRPVEAGARLQASDLGVRRV